MNLITLIQNYQATKRQLYVEVGDTIKQSRKKKGLLQSDIVRELNVTQTTVSNWEQGKTIPNLNQCEILEQLLK